MPILYRSIVRPLLFRLDPEFAHGETLRACAIAGRSAFLRRIVRARLRVTDARLTQTVAGIVFENPIGLAAGFDKNGVAVEMLGALGFGHIEIGSISSYASVGNPPPRLFRIPQDEGLVVHYGVPNDGAEAVASRVRRAHCAVPLGINLVKTNDPQRPAVDAEVLADYSTAFEKLQGLSRYIHLNLSCPNSAADRNYFDDVARIDALLQRLADKTPRVPTFLKLKPTTDRGFLRELVAIADRFPFVAGFSINLPAGKPAELNLKMSRADFEKLPGAVSGRPVASMLDSNFQLLHQVIGPASRFKLIAAGGVFSAEDAYRKIRLGASLVQLYTGIIYRGPGIVKEILQGLIALLERDGFAHISEAVGVDTR
jgi:dihydroorotate dehydrogenase